MPGRSTLTATGLSVPSGTRSLALCTCAIEAAATGRAELGIERVDGRAQRLLDRRARLSLREGRQAVLKGRKVAGELAADDVVAGGEELTELDVRRPERGERVGELRLVGVVGGAVLAERRGDAGEQRERPGRLASSGSTRAPDQASTAPALVNRAILAIAVTSISSS